jgi:hypothetical protein
VSNTLDPVTPLAGAAKMQTHFSGSALLVQDDMGHASSGAPSIVLRNTFRTTLLAGLHHPVQRVSRIACPSKSKHEGSTASGVVLHASWSASVHGLAREDGFAVVSCFFELAHEVSVVIVSSGYSCQNDNQS